LHWGHPEYAIGRDAQAMPFFDDLPRVDMCVPLSYAPKDGMTPRQ